jgi:hypothetical protein
METNGYNYFLPRVRRGYLPRGVACPVSPGADAATTNHYIMHYNRSQENRMTSTNFTLNISCRIDLIIDLSSNKVLTNNQD